MCPREMDDLKHLSILRCLMFLTLTTSTFNYRCHRIESRNANSAHNCVKAVLREKGDGYEGSEKQVLETMLMDDLYSNIHFEYIRGRRGGFDSIHYITKKCRKTTNQPSNDFGRKMGQLRSLQYECCNRIEKDVLDTILG